MPSLLTVSKAKEPIPGRYIVTLKAEVSLAAHVDSTPMDVTHEFDLINSYAGEFDDDDLNNLRADPDVDSIEQDGIYRTCCMTQSVPPTDPSKLNDF